MPDLGNNLLNHTAPRLQNPSSSNPHSQLPSFPVSVIQNREGSPTKSIFGSSPNGTTTVGVGRRSPIHDIQMDSIAEDSTEDSTTPTEMNPPASIAMVVSNHNPPSPRLGGIRRASVGDHSAAVNTGLMMPPTQAQQQQKVASRPTTPSSLQAGAGSSFSGCGAGRTGRRRQCRRPRVDAPQVGRRRVGPRHLGLRRGNRDPEWQSRPLRVEVLVEE